MCGTSSAGAGCWTASRSSVWSSPRSPSPPCSAPWPRPATLDDNLIDAYKARRALDYLVGFTLSPVLWRKLPGSRSAGRVQSVALRLICARELEIEAFKPREYWSIEVDLDTPRGERMIARLATLDGEKLGKYALGDQAAAERAAALVRSGRYRIAAVDPKRVKRNPAPPFTTSTLQQEASRKLGFAARRTMQVAQQLYEGIAVGGEQVGLITYMRTDGVQIAEQALRQARHVIGQRYGQAYVPEQPRRYRTKAKNAQEAHEAIRPTDLSRTPQSLSAVLKKDQARLYELIWKRALASQMASAEIDRVSVDIASDDGRTGLRATGQTVAFDGFLRVYQEGRDDARRDNGDDDDERRLPAVSVGEAMAVAGVTPRQARDRAAAALLRGEPGQATGGARHRPPLHLRVDHLGLAGPQLRASREAPLRAGGPRAHRHSVPRELLPAATSSTTSRLRSKASSIPSPPARSTGARC